MDNSGTFKLYLLALFPGFFAYHLLHSLGYLPYFGWFGALIAAGSACMLAASVMRALRNPIIERNYFIIVSSVYGLFLYCSAIILWNHLISIESYITKDGLIWSATNIILMLGFFLIGCRLNPKINNLTGLCIALSYAMFAVGTYYFYNSTNYTIILPVPEGADPESVASYQSMAMCVLYMTLTMSVFISTRFIKSMAMLASAVILYFIGSRTEFYLILSIAPLYIFINYGMRWFVRFAILASIPIAIIASTIELNERFADTINQFNEDSPRSLLLASGLQGIYGSPFFGDYLGQARNGNSVADYIHNILSVYQQFGIIALVIYSALLIFSLYIGFKLIRYARVYKNVEALLYASVISIIGVLASKALAWPLPALAWGLASNIILNHRSAISEIFATKPSADPKSDHSSAAA
ncbi:MULTISPECIES: hypothetical protein [Pseudomonas]|uniref:hypothetical protein n=1 Tax=Pseudomonas TaxID=286 RepID=UPI0002E52A40|nr:MULTISPECIES: hypothetical protein [Pseudomonas]MCE1032721.1 hypothetical protein [Pseudomonas asiatica]MCE1101972.1 hypothetical protein [Pseudomonas asiatica]MCE1107506.1 hypothetical protein [Pseudomonas asiatica]WJR25046.1 hypothetical protein LU687_011870 [Pseudomonas asiatica]